MLQTHLRLCISTIYDKAVIGVTSVDNPLQCVVMSSDGIEIQFTLYGLPLADEETRCLFLTSTVCPASKVIRYFLHIIV